LAGLLLLAAALLGGNAPGNASAADAGAAHHAAAVAGDALPSAASPARSLADAAQPAVETSSEGDDAPVHCATTASPLPATASIATPAAATTATIGRWRRRGQAPPRT